MYGVDATGDADGVKKIYSIDPATFTLTEIGVLNEAFTDLADGLCL